MDNIFLLSWNEAREDLASAFSPRGIGSDHELISALDGINELPFELTLVRLSEGENELVENSNLLDLGEIWLDYLPNSLAWPLMSKRLKDSISLQLTGKENIDWVIAKINGGEEQRIYYIPRFEKKLDVLDVKNTMYVKGTDHIIKPVFSISKTKNYGMFTKPLSHNLWKITSGIYVNETIKKNIQKEKFTGMVFEKTSLVR